MLAQLFTAIDSKDYVGFSSFLTPECTFRFANQPEVTGAADVTRYVKGFLDSIAKIEHSVEGQWDVPAGKWCHGTVTYTRKNGSELAIPFANLLELSGDKIHTYRIFADTSALYAE